MKRNCIGLCVLLLSIHCSRPVTEKIDISKARVGLRLADGTTISTDEYDEYNPILIQRADSRLALLFASDRDCAGCSAGMHNLFIAVSPDTYDDDLQMPVFDVPVVARPNGSTPLNSAQRIRFSALRIGSDVAVAYEVGAGTYSFEMTPANQLTGTGTGLGGIGNSTRTTDTFLGLGPEVPSMISRDGTMTVRYSKIDAAHNGGALNNFLLSFAQNVSMVPTSVTGYNTGMIFSDPSGIWFSSLDFPIAPAISVNFSLLAEGLFVSHASVSVTNAAVNDFLLFSADDLISDDLYVVTSHSIADLWLQDTLMPPGDLSDSKAFRNNWQTLAATLPQTRAGMVAGVVGTKGYLITGFNGSAANTIYEFDFETETFTNCGNGSGTPCTTTWSTGLYGGSSAVVGSQIYILGGTPTGSTTSATNTFGYFDASNYSVTTGLPAYPLNRMSPAVAVVGNDLFAMGGSSNTTDCSGTNYNCTNNYSYTLGGSWSGALTATPYGFTNAAAVAYLDSIYIFGGTTDGTNGIASVSEYSVTGNSWINCGSTCPNLSQARFDLQAITVGQKVYIMGGMHSGSYTTYNLVEEFDLNTQMLTNCNGGCSTMPVAIANGSVLLYRNSLYYFGGRTDLSTYVNTVYKYTP